MYSRSLTAGLAGLVLVALAAPAHAQTSARALADVSSIAPGESFRVAVEFEMDRGWHIYWKHPGDSGLPTEVTAESRDGVTFGAPRMPVPARFGQPGGIAGFGYAGSVMVVMDVTTSEEISAPLELSLTADWLMCKDRCIPGRASFTVPIGVGERMPTFDAERIDAWETRMPGAAASPAPFALNVRRSTADEGGSVALTLTWADTPPPVVDWFPNPAMEISIEKVEVLPTSAETTVTFEWSKWGEPSLPTLDSLVYWTDDDGRVGGHEISFNLYE